MGAALKVAVPFLSERTPRPLSLQQSGLEPLALHLGHGQNAFEVVVVSAKTKLTAGALQSAWKARRGGRASPVLLVALHGGEAALCGQAGENPPVRFGVDLGQAERLCCAALVCPTGMPRCLGCPSSALTRHSDARPQK
jgi:hypothetical protein